MSVFLATVAVVCTISACNDYVIDNAQDKVSQVVNTSLHQKEYNSIWEDEQGLTDWLKKYQIGETIFEIVSIDIESQDIDEDLIP
ncbi:hypothetical protein MT_57060 [Pseudomonas phage phiPto-bp6g]|nr:hypothetical protein MT_57060 [Pseudomonas phage phiPto-bp6g]